MCAGLAQHMDKQQLATLLGVDAPTVGKSEFVNSNQLLLSAI